MHDIGAVEEKLLQEFSYMLGFRVSNLNCGGATPIPHVQRWLAKAFPQCNITENYASSTLTHTSKHAWIPASLIST